MALQHVFKAFFLDHRDGLVQTVKVVRRGGAVEVMREDLGRGAGAPIPVTADAGHLFAQGVGLVVEKDKAHAGGCHQPLLRAGDHHVDAPGVHLEPVAAERGHAIGHQKGRVAGGVHRVAGGLDVVPDAGRGIGVDGKNRLDLPLRVGAEPFGDGLLIEGVPLAEIEDLDLDPQFFGHAGPTVGKNAGGGDQHLVAGGDGVGQCRFPCAVAIDDIDGQVVPCARDGLQARHEAWHHVDQLAFIDVGRGAMHGPQDPVGDDRRAGDGKIGEAGFECHGGFLRVRIPIRPVGHGRQRGVTCAGARGRIARVRSDAEKQNVSETSQPEHATGTYGNRALIGWVWRDYLKRHWKKIGLALILMAIEGSMLGALSYIVQPMFDTVFIAGDRGAVYWVAAGIAGIFIVRAMSDFGHRILMYGAGLSVITRMQRDMVRHLLTLDSAYFHTNPPGTLIERVRGDTTLANQIWMQVLGTAWREVVTVVVLLGVAISVDWRWTLVAVMGVPLLIVPVLGMQRYVRKKALAAREAAAKLSTRLDEIFHGVNTIKLNTSEDHEDRRFAAAVESYFGQEMKARIGAAGIPSTMDVVAAMGFAGVVIYGGNEIIDGEKTVGQFMSFFHRHGAFVRADAAFGQCLGRLAIGAGKP